ncbi:cupin-like domain-containing protein [Flavobacterium sp.]|uniref:cupin-like domain-containing protein n=1 Tax=Flavobacterium sp. TaxID=239 RepID=UPI00260AB9CD|nr:cupin-like domain-containing protein [Flavobacterium sp.]
MAFNYIEIDRVEKLTKEVFIDNYYNLQKPLVITNQVDDWPAVHKWSFKFLKEIAGDKIVPLYNSGIAECIPKLNEPDLTLPMSQYIEILQRGPTDLRIFLYNLMKDVPDLKTDIRWPELGIKLIKTLPFIFFGGQGTKVYMQYDIDLSNIFDIHFEGKKQCILVAPNEAQYIYRLPYSWICHENIDFDNPDFEKFPALEMITPYITNLEHGEMLYIPEGWWYYMKYTTPGFSLRLKALAGRPKNLLKGIRNMTIMQYYDNWMRQYKGQAWLNYKNRESIRRTNATLK